MILLISLMIASLKIDAWSELDCKNLGESDQTIYFCEKINKTRLNELQIPKNIKYYRKIIFINKNLPILNEFADVVVHAIDISSNEIETIQNNSFSKLKELKEICLRDNKLQSIEFLTMSDSNYEKLEILDLSYNWIENLTSSFPISLNFLKQLYLNNNRIKYVSKNCFENLRSITILVLDANELKSIYNSIISGSSSVSFKNNRIEIILDNIENNFKIDELFLNDNNLSIISSSYFSAYVAKLHLEKNNLVKLDSNCFNKITGLEMLHLSFNQIQRMDPYTFHSLDNLNFIDLSFNFIEVIEPETFVDLKNLETIYIMNNKIKFIQSSAIKNCEILRVFDLKFNEIQTLSQEFHDFPKFFNSNIVLEMRIKYNEIFSINNSIIHGLRHVKTLYIQANEINFIKEFSFFDFKNLSILGLRGLSIEHLKENSFNGLSLEKLDLENNKISLLNNYTFNGLKCAKLYLGSNNIRFIDSKAFFGINKVNILLLDDNFISNILPDIFQNMLLLDNLNLSNNLIKSVKQYNFKFLVNLKNLDLSSNKIWLIEKKAFNGLDSLEYLNLSKNFIESIRSFYFNDLIGLSSLTLNKNRIYKIDQNSFKYLKNLSYLDLGSNRLIDIDFELNEKLTYLNMENNEIKSLNNLNKLINIIELNLNRNDIEIFDEKIFQLKNLSILNLNNNRIKFIYNNTFNNIESIDVSKLCFSSNGIKSLDFMSKLGTQLSYLDFSNNHITKVEVDFKKFRKLKYLDLSNNLIEEIQLDSFVFDSIMEKIDLKNISYRQQIKISNLIKKFSSRPILDINLSFNYFQVLNISLFYDYKLNLTFSKISFFIFQKKDPNLKELDCTSYMGNLTHVLYSFKKFHKLKSLIFRNLSLENLDFVFEFDNLGELTNLDASHNNIETIHTYHFSFLKSINYLDLSYNQLEYVEQFTFISCKVLKSINLRNNRLKSFDFVLMTNVLENIKISNNLIEYFNIHKTQGFIENMALLDISNNQLESMEFLKFLFKEKLRKPSITQLYLRNNNFKVVTNEIFQNIDNLIYLDMSINLINSIESSSFKYLTLLEHLDLSNNRLNSLEKYTFKHLSRLKYLNLSHNNLFNLNNDLFKDLINLNTLDLENNNLTNIAEGLFHNLNELTDLNLQNNKNVLFGSNSFKNMASIRNVLVDFETIKNEKNKYSLVNSLSFNQEYSLNDVIYYRSINLLYKSEFIDCELSLFYIRSRILVNFYTERQTEYFLKICSKIKLY